MSSAVKGCVRKLESKNEFKFCIINTMHNKKQTQMKTFKFFICLQKILGEISLSKGIEKLESSCSRAPLGGRDACYVGGFS